MVLPVKKDSYANHIIRNTLMLYLRQLVSMGVSLYAVRVVLGILGAVDYGIYNAVAGIVLLLSFLTNTMSSATQRFFSFALGRNDQEMLKYVFGTNLVIYCGIALIAVFLFETIGLWFVHMKMVIPPGKIEEVRWLYQFAIAGFLASLISSPYIAIIIAHEEMNFYAYISILDACLKLGAVLAIPLLPLAKLPAYGLLLFVEAFAIAAIYCIFCSFKYKECSFVTLRFKRSMLKEIVDFTWWTLFGCITTVSRYQAITILVNQFFNPTVVAARAIALNISNVLTSFTSNFNMGMYPPIIKAWSSGKKQEMYDLIYLGCRITFFLTWIFSLPCMLKIDFLLHLWLKKIPEGSAFFAQLAIMEGVILSISLPLATAARAPGKMKTYELVLGIMQILILPISWIVLKCGGEAYSTFIVAIIFNILMFFTRLYLVHNLIGLSIWFFTIKVIIPVCKTVLLSLIPLIFMKFYISETVFSTLVLIGISFCVIAFFVIFCGFTAKERLSFFLFIKNKFKKAECP